MTEIRRGTFQMLWDCPSCGTTKLLGVDHRHCPNCGAPQEENLRYFPSKSERVPTAYRGSTPDWECQHCGTACGAEDAFCMGCGAPRGDSPSVHVRGPIDADASETGEQAKRDWDERRRATRAQQQAAASTSKGRSHQRRGLAQLLRQRRKPIGIGAGVASMIGLIWFACSDKQVELVVEGHAWTRTIPVEQFSTLRESQWCDSTPADARVLSRTNEVHHYDKVPDGEDCREVPGSCSETCTNVDNGNGSFSEVCTQSCTSARRECTTRYREVPVYADKCDYEVDRWVRVRAAEASGADRAPVWPPEPAFSGCTIEQLGCERLGARFGTYSLELTSAEGDRYWCPFDQARWETIDPGTRWIGGVSRIGNELDCESLTLVEH